MTRWLSLLALAACAHGPKPGDPVDPGDRFVILHTNDMHAHFRPSVGDFSSGEAVGGIAALSGVVEQARATWGDERVLLLDAGDLVSGTPIDEYDIHGVSSGAMLDLLSAAGYDAWAIGNHEFDRGYDHLAGFVAASTVPVLSSNLYLADPGAPAAPARPPAFPTLRASEVFEVGGQRIAVIGATTDGVARLTAGDLGPIAVGDPIAAVRAEAIRLRTEADVVVALTHLGVDEDKALASAVPELDLIVGGHSHTRLDAPVRVGNTWIVQAGCYLQGIGVAIVDPAPDGTVGLEWHVESPGANAALPPRAEVAAFVDTWSTAMDRDWGVVVGTSQVALGRTYHEESPLGRYMGETLRKGVGADLAVYNSGGLRADLPTGPLTREALYQILPFGNEVVTVEVRGSDLLGLAVRNATALLDPDKASVIQQDGLQYGYRIKLGAPEIAWVRVGGVPLDPDRIYKVAANDFVLGMWPRIFGASPGTITRTGTSDLDLLIARVSEGPVVAAPPPGGVLVE